jgi:hypothetical protein
MLDVEFPSGAKFLPFLRQYHGRCGPSRSRHQSKMARNRVVQVLDATRGVFLLQFWHHPAGVLRAKPREILAVGQLRPYSLLGYYRALYVGQGPCQIRKFARDADAV